MKKLTLLLLISFYSISAYGATKFVINNGHYSPIVSMQYNVQQDLIFAAEESGALSIWHSKEQRLRSHFQLTSNVIDKILISPVEKNISVLSHDTEKYYLSVWNWNTEKQIISRIIEEQPLFLEYSATGKYLIYGNTQNPSLTFLNARTGVKLNYLNRLPSIYNFAYLGSSEKNIMTYSSSGLIKFYDFKNSAELKSVNTMKELKDLNIIRSNNAYLTSQSNNTVYLIERLSGLAKDEISFRDLEIFYQNRENGNFLTIDRSNRNFVLKQWTIDEDKFAEIGNPLIIPSSISITSLVEAGGKTIAGDEKGTIYTVDWENLVLNPLSENYSKNITDLTVSADGLTLSGDDGLITLESPFFQNNKNIVKNPSFIKKYPLLESNRGLLELNNGKLLLWGKEDPNGSISIINTIDGKIEFEYNDFDTPLLDISHSNGKIITLDKSGTIKIIDIEQNEEIFSYSAIGLQDISMVDETTLFAGRTSTSGKSPAITINIETKETLLVNDDRFLIFDSIAVEKNRQFFTMGLLQDENITKTLLKKHDYGDLGKMETLIIYNGEDINAQVLINPQNSRTIYAKLGTSGIYTIVGNKVTKYSNKKPVKKIYLNGTILYSLNMDNSISLFKAATGQKLYTIYIFNDDSWALIPTTSDLYYGSPGVEKNIISYRSNRVVNLAPSIKK